MSYLKRPLWIRSSYARRLRVEALEDRRLLAVFPVSNLLNSGAGSLRDAITQANGAAGPDEITFSVSGTIDLASQLPTITDSLTITGPGADQLTLNAGHGTDNVPNTGDGFRVLNIDGGANPTLDVAIHGLTLTGGDIFGFGGDLGKGGAILNRERLTVTESKITGNGATTGGGMYNYFGYVTITSSTFSNNHASANGGAALNRAGQLTVLSSTFSGNSAVVSGGGISNSAYGLTSVTGSTISNNSAELGGGIQNASHPDALLRITGSTLSGNTAIDGGGIYSALGSNTTLTHTIVANSLSGGDTYTGGSSFNGSFNLIEDGSGGIAGTIMGDPMLVSLADQGGPTKTHRLLPGSPAIDAGDPAASAGSGGVPLYDQRGIGFDRVRSFGAGTLIDIGSFEVQNPLSMPLPPLIVDSIVDEVDFDLSVGNFSLREAVALANLQAGADTITFDPTLFSTQQTIGLKAGQLNVTDDLTLTGPGMFLLTIDAGNGNDNLPATGDGNRVFHVDDGDDNVDRFVFFSGVTITGGDVSGDGGGILNREDLTLDLTRISNNSATGNGGGIFGGDQSHPMSLTNSTLSGNLAGNKGGGIYSGGFSSATITRSTLYDNQAATGGGIYNRSFGTLNLNHVTISGNAATGSSTDQGGAIFNGGIANISSSTIVFNNGNGENGAPGIQNGGFASASIHNSIISGNNRLCAPGTCLGNNLVGSAFSGDYNLLGVTATTTGGAHDLSEEIRPYTISPLGYHGGPTKTHVPFRSSRAINNGASADLVDQRGAPFQRDDGNGVDIGAVELRNFSLVVDTVEDTYDLDLSPGDVSLREAMHLASRLPGGGVISFDSTLFAVPQTILLNEQLPHMFVDLTINGPGVDLLTIDAGHGPDQLPDTQDGFRIFDFRDFQEFPEQQVALSGMTLTGGDVSGSGGAILTTAELSIHRSTITGNAASDRGGGIHLQSHDEARLNLTDSTLSGNSAGDGGAIFMEAGTEFNISGSTISGNLAARFGGGIFVSSDNSFKVMRFSTITENTALQDGGGIFLAGSARAGVYSTIVSGNNDDGAPNNVAASGSGFLNGDGNLFGSGDFTGGVDDVFSDTPGLGPLANNGGPTKTHALLPGSPAINGGIVSTNNPLPAFDQRGVGFDRLVGGQVDIGAIELQTLPSADFDSDGDVDGADFLVWQRGFGTPSAMKTDGDADNDSDVDADDLTVWQQSFGQPQPLSATVSREQKTVESQQQAASNNETLVTRATIATRDGLVDAAIALSLMSEPSEEKILVEHEMAMPHDTASDLAFASSTSFFTNSAVKVDSYAPSEYELEASESEWLADELLERIFE